MTITTLSSKGQITVPAALIRTLGLRPGERLAVVAIHDGIVLKRLSGPWPDALAGSIPAGTYGDPDEYIHRERESWPT
ncbi:MAG: AbrB/MazE/SpoVT family DNA-binding domain-containing protein [Chloroflexota bacterium]